MTERTIASVVPAQATPEGVGVTVYRPIGTARQSELDPFLLLDEFTIAKDATGAGFPDHPHRGFETVTYMLSGRMEHGDNAGNSGVIGPGDAQWMTAGRGVVHSEMPKSDGEDIRGMQLWVNLAAKDKMIPPHYQDITADRMPVADVNGGATVRVIAGTYGDATGPVEGIALSPLYLDIALAAEGAVTVPLAANHTAFAYVLEGTVTIGGDTLNKREMGVLNPGDAVTISATADARLILVAARALNEPIARYGPFVMNTREEIQQAMDDFRMGKF